MLAILERDVPITIHNPDILIEDLNIPIKRISIADILSKTGITKSKSEAKRLLKQDGISMCRKSGKWEKMKEFDTVLMIEQKDMNKIFEKYPDLVIEYDNLLI